MLIFKIDNLKTYGILAHNNPGALVPLKMILFLTKLSLINMYIHDSLVIFEYCKLFTDF